MREWPSSLALAACCVLGCSRASDLGAATFRVESLASPCESSSRLPRFSAGGGLALSWVEEPASETAELHCALWSGSGWTAPVRIASGQRWFVNWADFPALAMLDEQRWLAQYLERSANGTYDYNVQIVRTLDGGDTWSEPTRLHDDPGPGEHGFVSLVPLDQERCTAIWLDGRLGRESTDAPGHGAMALYTRTVRVDGALEPEILLDERVCDCCPTAAARTPDGALLVAYRDRSMDEVRDITLVRLAPGAAPEQLWNSGDGWRIPGCPVNGPVLVVAGERIALAWFTLGADGVARVLCALSNDSGRSFCPPVTLARERTHGRVDAVFDGARRLIVTWLEGDANAAEWRVARVDRDARVVDEHTVATTSVQRESGLARLAWDGSGVLFAFTEVGDDRPRLALRRLTWD